VEEVLRLTHSERPLDGSTQWSTRTLAARVGIGNDQLRSRARQIARRTKHQLDVRDRLR